MKWFNFHVAPFFLPLPKMRNAPIPTAAKMNKVVELVAVVVPTGVTVPPAPAAVVVPSPVVAVGSAVETGETVAVCEPGALVYPPLNVTYVFPPSSPLAPAEALAPIANETGML